MASGNKHGSWGRMLWCSGQVLPVWSERLYWLLWTSVQKRSFEKRETKEKRGVHVCEVLETEPAWEHVSDTRSREKVV